MGATEIKILMSEHGTLFALLPNGEIKQILVDVPGTSHYGILTVGGPTEGAEEIKCEVRL